MDQKIELIGERLTFGEDDHAQSLSVERPNQPDLTLLLGTMHVIDEDRFDRHPGLVPGVPPASWYYPPSVDRVADGIEGDGHRIPDHRHDAGDIGGNAKRECYRAAPSKGAAEHQQCDDTHVVPLFPGMMFP